MSLAITTPQRPPSPFVHSPSRSYLICANQRSGSTLLCRALSDTGVAGHPAEYFLCGDPSHFPPGWAFWEDGPLAREHGVTGRGDYLELVYRLGSTDNGVFGAKVMFNNVPPILEKFGDMPRFAGMTRPEIFHAAFPDLHVVLLTRRDTVRQAVSWWRAAQEGVWVVSDDEPAPPAAGEPVYVFDVIDGMERLILDGERGWRQLCDELGVVPHEVVYEELVSEDGYEATIRGVLEHLGVESDGVESDGVESDDIAVAPPRTHRQADALNDEWVQRFNEERTARAGQP